MKNKIHFRMPFSILFAMFLVISAGSEIYAQGKKTELKDFKVILEKTDSGISMKSLEGSAWSELTFDLVDYRPQAISEFGMIDLKNFSSHEDSNLADFLFTIVKTENGIELKGIKGTAWSELKFTLDKNHKQAITQFGMSSLN